MAHFALGAGCSEPHTVVSSVLLPGKCARVVGDVPHTIPSWGAVSCLPGWPGKCAHLSVTGKSKWDPIASQLQGVLICLDGRHPINPGCPPVRSLTSCMGGWRACCLPSSGIPGADLSSGLRYCRKRSGAMWRPDSQSLGLSQPIRP